MDEKEKNGRTLAGWSHIFQLYFCWKKATKKLWKIYIFWRKMV